MHTEPALPGMPEPPLTLAGLFSIPTGISRLPERCWTAPADNEPHFDSEARAQTEIHEDPERHPENTKPQRLTHTCWTATAACGRTVGSEDFDVTHFPDPDMALQYASEEEFTVVDGVLRCEDGAACEVKL